MENKLQVIVDYLKSHQLKVMTAESCAAGMIAARLAEPPGAGEWLDCAFVSYSKNAKIRCLEVDVATIERYGLTSEQVARAMAEGALHASDADLAIASTGVAGPSNGDGEEVIGTVCLAWSFRHSGGSCSFSEKKYFDGARNAVRDAATAYALQRVPIWHSEFMAAGRSGPQRQLPGLD